MTAPMLAPPGDAKTACMAGPPPSDFWGPRLLLLIVGSCCGSAVFGFRVAIATLTVLGFCAALVGLFRPSIGLLGVGILCVLDSLTRTLVMSGGILRWNTFNYVLLMMVIISFPVMLRLADQHTRLLQGLLLIMTMGLLLTPDLHTGLFGLINVVAVFGLLLYFIRALYDREVYFWLALLNGVLAALGMLAFLAQSSSLPVINPNAWSYVPVTALFSICLGFPFARNGLSRMLLLVLTVVNCIWVFLSGSRGSMLVALICVVYILGKTRGMAVKLVFPLAGIAVGLTVVSAYGDMQSYALGRINKLFDDQRTMKSRTSGRSDLAEAGLEMFRENPMGAGTGAFRSEVEDVIGFQKQSHSAWIKTLVENGFLGGIMLALYLGSFAWASRKDRRPETRGLGFFMTAALTCAFFSTEFNGKGLWFLAAGGTTLLAYRRSAACER